MFWGDIILKHPKLIRELAKLGRADLRVSRGVQKKADRQVSPTIIALNWGYEAGHPFEKEAAQFAKAEIPFYVCPALRRGRRWLAGTTMHWPICALPPKPEKNLARWVFSTPIGAMAVIRSRWR